MHAKSNRRTFFKRSAILGSGLLLVNSGTLVHGQELQSDVFGIIKKRRSVRKFKSTPVPNDHSGTNSEQGL